MPDTLYPLTIAELRELAHAIPVNVYPHTEVQITVTDQHIILKDLDSTVLAFIKRQPFFALKKSLS